MSRTRRVMLAAMMTVAAIITALFIPAASAQPPQPLTLTAGSPFQIQSVLDGQGCYPNGDQSCWVRNPTNNVWNDQDDAYYRGSGYVKGTTSFSQGMFADFAGGSSNIPHAIYVLVTSSTNNLDITLNNDHGDSWQVGQPTKIGNRYKWLFCTFDRVASRGGVFSTGDPSLVWPAVPNSNYLPDSTVYGYAEPVVYTLTLSSVGNTAKSVNVGFEIAGSGPSWAAPRTIKECTP